MPGIIRPFTLKDLKSLCHVLENVWDFDDHPRSLRSRLLVLRYALKCLLKSQAAFSAYVEDRFAGAVFLTLKTGRGHVLFLPLLTQLLVLRALITAFLWLTRYSFKYDYARFEAKAQALTLQDFKDFPRSGGTIYLLIVDRDTQGRGIGRRLVERASEFFKERQVSFFFLFTDTFCNYGFYRAAGFKEEVARDVTAVFGPRPEDRIKARFFIFSRKVSP